MTPYTRVYTDGDATSPTLRPWALGRHAEARSRAHRTPRISGVSHHAHLGLQSVGVEREAGIAALVALRVVQVRIEAAHGIERALEVSGERTKKAAVTRALQEFIARRGQKRLVELMGKLEWDSSFDYKGERSRT